jgi:hypothetical protein
VTLYGHGDSVNSKRFLSAATVSDTNTAEKDSQYTAKVNDDLLRDPALGGVQIGVAQFGVVP